MVVAAAALAHAQQRSAPLPTLPLTQLDDRARSAAFDNQTLSLTFSQPVPVRELLLQIVANTPLSIVADPFITESFIGDLKNVTVRQALDLVLPPFGLDYAVDGTFVRVFRRDAETQIFEIAAVAISRTGRSEVGGAAADGSFARVSSEATSDAFGDTVRGVQALLSPRGAVTIDRRAGVLQVTDVRDRLDRVAAYLDAVHERALRQVQIDARVVEVELSTAGARALDWTALAQGGVANPAPGARPLVNGLRVSNVARFLDALAAQGTVTTVAAPRVLALNNEPAVVREAAFTLGVTARVGSDRSILLAMSPIVRLAEPAASGVPAVTHFGETDTLARVADGETLVVGGFGRDRETREQKTGSPSGGWFGRTTVVTRTRVEVLMLLTPTIVRGPATE
jgi:type II secretory pathway component GspD/PulD (secretin)